VIDIESLLTPTTEEPPCGPDLEYDAAFLALDQSARGKPEQQFGETVIPAEEPVWGDVRTAATELLGRSKDLRAAILLVRAWVHNDGYAGLLPGLRLIQQLLDRYWDEIYPRLDPDENNDPTMRMNALAPLADVEGVVRDLRGAFLVDSRQHGSVLVRDAEIALGKLPQREGAEPVSQSKIEAILAAVVAEDPEIGGRIDETFQAAKALSAYIAERVGAERAPDFKPLLATLYAVQQICPRAQLAPAEIEGGEAGAVAGEARPISGDIRTRQDALAMIDKMVAYFERNEPTNPAPLLLKRAKRLMNMSFVDIIKDMVPDSMGQIETIAGLGREE
jgi:type VI secretion system protein ImpA